MFLWVVVQKEQGQNQRTKRFRTWQVWGTVRIPGYQCELLYISQKIKIKNLGIVLLKRHFLDKQSSMLEQFVWLDSTTSLFKNTAEFQSQLQ